MKLRLVLLLLLISTVSGTAIAGELRFIISGKAKHSGGQNLNEDISGWGFEYNFDNRGNWIPLVTGASFLDSNYQASSYFGAGSKRRFLLGSDSSGFRIDVGALAFTMKRYDYNNNSPFIAALPFISFGNPRFAINMTYVPKLGPNFIAFSYYQVSLKLLEF